METITNNQKKKWKMLIKNELGKEKTKEGKKEMKKEKKEGK